jgi:hypothetical protein
MADAIEVLQIMKDVAKSRISMLRDGITFHPPDKKALYLQEYEEKLREIEHQIRRLSIRIVPPPSDTPSH